MPHNLRHCLYIFASTLLLCGATVRAEVYKYVENGVITYSAEKPRHGTFDRLETGCLLSYIGCDMANSDWGHIPLNHKAFKEIIEESAQTHAVEAALIRAVIHAESNFNHQARSKAGAQGLMQLMPNTQRLLQVENPYDPRENINAGTRLLQGLLQKYGNLRHAAAAYNAGEEAVERYRGVPPYEETRNYVRRVTQLYERYRRLEETATATL